MLILALGAGGVARAELAKDGAMVVSFNGGITPKQLPRTGAAPVAVAVEAGIRTTDGSDPPPQLRRIVIAINRSGRLFSRGLPTCNVRRIQPATMAAARRICGGAIIGSGRVRVRVNLENQRPFTVSGPLLAFNAKPARGGRRILAQVYSDRPPSAFVLTFRLVRRPGTFGTVISTTLPRTARRWAYVTYFEMRLRRQYSFRGRQRSFLSAACAAPAGFPGAVYPFARANFEFTGGRRVSSTLTRSCRVR